LHRPKEDREETTDEGFGGFQGFGWVWVDGKTNQIIVTLTLPLPINRERNFSFDQQTNDVCRDVKLQIQD